jgi:hypothetical protein
MARGDIRRQSSASRRSALACQNPPFMYNSLLKNIRSHRCAVRPPARCPPWVSTADIPNPTLRESVLLPLAIRESHTRLSEMISAPTKSAKSRPAQPRWGWSGVSKLARRDQELHVEHLVAMLPAKKSSPAEVVAELVELRARFHRWLHQDEFGPRRGEQTAALRAHIKLVRELCRLLQKRRSRSWDGLDAALRNGNDGLSPVVAALGDAAAEVESALQIAGASNPDMGCWLSRVRRCARTLSEQIETLDDNTDGQIFLTALYRNFELSQTAASEEFGLLDAECWLNGYWSVLVETLNSLNDQRGAQERVSLKLLVEELCNLYERETEEPAAAHGVKGDVYTACAETKSGRFVTAAVGAMLPDKSWFDGHSQYANLVRAETFLPDEQAWRRQRARARQVLVIMKDFVARRARPVEVPTI